MWVALFLALALLGSTAHAQSPPARGFDFELRQTLTSQLEVAERRLASMRGAARGETPAGATLAATLAQQGCAASDDAYWTAAWRWMIANATPRLNAGTTLVAGPYESDLRRQIENVEEQIAARPAPQFLAAGESPAGRPVDAPAALRQRAEWATAIPPQIVRLKATHESDPTSMRYALAFAVWTRGFCTVRTQHAVAAHAALDAGYPRAAAPEDRTELAFAVLVAASGDTKLATDVLVAGGEGMSAPARKLVGDASRR
jgi:hypothetical protein